MRPPASCFRGGVGGGVFVEVLVAEVLAEGSEEVVSAPALLDLAASGFRADAGPHSTHVALRSEGTRHADGANSI
jgi:hypothetical protein